LDKTNIVVCPEAIHPASVPDRMPREYSVARPMETAGTHEW
jgi:hypothetical protein